MGDLLNHRAGLILTEEVREEGRFDGSIFDCSTVLRKVHQGCMGVFKPKSSSKEITCLLRMDLL